MATITSPILSVIDDPRGRELPHVRLTQEAADTLLAWKQATWREVRGADHGMTRPSGAGTAACDVINKVVAAIDGRSDYLPSANGSFHAVLIDPNDYTIHATLIAAHGADGWVLEG